MSWLAILKILKIVGKWFGKNWKLLLIIAVVGALVLTVTTFIGKYNYRGSVIEKQKVDISRLEGQLEDKNKEIDRLVKVNLDWSEQADAWNKATEDLQKEGEATYARYLEERRARLAALERLSDAEARVTTEITAPDCEGAVGQLIAVLEWDNE